jgi:penicillin-binding protein 1A
MYTGYFLIILFTPIFIVLVMLTSTEAKKVQSFQDVLDNQIKIEEVSLPQTSYMKDEKGNTISELYKSVNRIYIPSAEIPTFLNDLFIVSEDQHFYEHPGFDLPAIARALAINMKSQNIEEGASTITQQLARNLYLDYEQSYNRKLTEVLYAYELERAYPKDHILELYLNTIYFQNGAYGIEAASQTYFQKHTKELTKAQLAFLAAIPNNPSYYDPVKHFGRTKERQERLVDLLMKNGYVNSEEAEKIKGEPIRLSLRSRVDSFPDYTTFVEKELRDLIAHSEGFDRKIAAAQPDEQKALSNQLDKRVEEVVSSGTIIETALNPSLQNRAVKAVKDYLPYEDIEGSAAVIDHKKHLIVALVGGKNYKKYNFHRAFQGYRQPGSSIKPLLVYAPYIERTNASLYERISADSVCINGYCPKNYGGARYGMVTLESAFIHSFNTPAVRILNKVGVENAFKDLSHFGFKKVTTQDHVLPAAIGGFTYGMTSLELSSAFTVFANDGYYQPSRAIKKVTDLAGNVLYQWDDKPVSVWSKPTITKMRILLNQTVLTGTARKAYFPSSYIGGKTGTTNDYNDYWFIGLTENLTAGVWVGKDNPSNIESVESAAPQLKIWKKIVSGSD